MNRNRSGYSQIAQLFSTGLKIPGKGTEIRHLIQTYFDQVPRLPALKDEFKKAGLV